jgi:hypothetical protein
LTLSSIELVRSNCSDSGDKASEHFDNVKIQWGFL